MQNLKEVLDQLDRGLKIAFDATIKGLGNELHTRHFHANNIKLVEGFKEIVAHIHDNGRYAKKNIRGRENEHNH